MAASASLSLCTPHSISISCSSSRPIVHLPLQQTSSGKFILGKPISRLGISKFPVLNAYRRFGLSGNRGDECGNDGRSFFKPSVSAQQENQPHQTNNEDKSGSDKKFQSKLKILMQAYKEAILVGDSKTIFEVENMIYTMEKEKNNLVEKVSSLSSEISSGKEKLVRLQADFDNYRKRSEKERLTVRSDAQGEVIESLLPMVDSFEKAKQQIKTETEMEKKIDTSYQGIYKQFVEIMRSLRVSVVPTIGKAFDPAMHEAIAREESNEFKEGIIIQEFRRGFLLGDRLIRPAMVKVSSGPARNKPQPPSQQPASVAGADNR